MPRPDLIFRLFGYGCLALIAGFKISQGGDPGLWLLFGFAGVWPGVWVWLARRVPSVLVPSSGIARAAHAGECALATAVTALSGLDAWQSVAVGLLCLTGVTALGGMSLLVPSATLVAATLVSIGQARGYDLAPDGAALAGLGLGSGFLVGLAGLSHARVRRLKAVRRRAASETAALRDRNARLLRYLPEMPADEPAGDARRPPREIFVTVAFVDVVGFVELVAARPVTEVAEVLNDFMTNVDALARRRGGIIGKFLGDGVLLYFREPTRPAAPGELGTRPGRSHAASSCAWLCLELGPMLEELSRGWRGRGLSLELSLRMGIASGYCAVGDWGGHRLDYTLIGTPVNLASRLQAQAEPGGVLLAGPTAALLDRDPVLSRQLRKLGPREVRGLGPVVVHALCGSAKVRAIPLPTTAADSGFPDGRPWTRSS